ncbi:MAG: alkene reductase [Alphaproteobacteria bacterium 64-11]|nr:alkene reductase [Alphaproteobacteria bacterium]OJU14208.1 MAG: alkene reductase [Alphaproteobacteria bacterium 64-11]
MPTLFDPLQCGDIALPNRILMAPLTRRRATPDTRVPTDLQVEYYRQRADAGLIFSEATSVTPMGVGYAATPGIWSDEQVEGWKKVTRAVHGAGGRMVLQLWHVGRISDPIFLNGALPEAPSAVRPKGFVSLVRPQREFVTPRALELSEIADIIAAYRKGAENARAAGFDGVHIHGANGYLLDQFLQDSTNRRTDAYGGTREKRARLMLEVADVCAEVWGPKRVGMHLAPRMDSHDMGDSDRLGTFTYVARELGRRGLGWIAAREYVFGKDAAPVDSQGNPKPITNPESIGPKLKEAFGGVYIANEGFTFESAQKALADGWADAVAFGKLFIANPDLVTRLRTGAPLNAWDADTFYSGGEKGYTDYPALVPA